MTAPNPRGPEPTGVSAVLALAMAVISFFALAVLALAILSTTTATEIIAVPGLGPVPGVLGMAAGVLAFALGLAAALRRPRASFRSVPVIALWAAFAHLAVVWIAAAAASGDVIAATVVAGDLVRQGPSLVIVLTAAVAAWGGIALRRTRAQQPRWPWEHDRDPEA